MQISRLGLGTVVCLLLACNNPGGKISEAPGTTDTISGTSLSTAIDTMLAGCYSSVSGQDTSALQILTNGAVVAGPLSYHLFEKDRNDGNFQGEVQGNILSGWYLFRSEGIMSVRQVAWKIMGAALWPATGEVTQHGDTMVFKSMEQLRFDSTQAFIKVPCTL